MTKKILFGLLLCGLFFTLGAQIGRSYRAERFDVDVVVQSDGSLLVEEVVDFNFQGGPFTFVFRELPVDRTDGIVDIVAAVDGVVWPHGDGPGEVEISGNDPIRVTWHMPPTSDATHSFTLSYRPLGVAVRGDAADVVNWQALPDEYEYAIDSSRVTFHLPPGSSLAAAPEVRAGDAAVSTDGDRVVFETQNLSDGDPLVVRLTFPPQTFIGPAAEWQTREAVHRSRAWMPIAAAAAVLLGGLLAFARAARPYSRSVPKATSFSHKPPIDLPPALAGYLAHASAGWNQGLATLLDLGQRGVLEIEQVREKSAWRSPEFAITLLERPQEARPHEQALLDALFTDRRGAPQDVITLTEMGQLITSSRWRRFTESVEGEALHEGFVEPAAKRRQKRIMGWGVALMLLALPLMLVAFLLRDFFGMWTLITAGAVFFTGVLGAIVSSTVSPLSDKGFQYATAFEPFRRFLQEAAKGKTEVPDATYYEAYLPYATTYGVADRWVKEQEKDGPQRAPDFFHAPGADAARMASFVVAISAASSSGGAAGGAGAAGAAAAGGGASGAG